MTTQLANLRRTYCTSANMIGMFTMMCRIGHQELGLIIPPFRAQLQPVLPFKFYVFFLFWS